MSASKNKLIDKANEEAKKPKKARPKRVAVEPEPEETKPVVVIEPKIQLTQAQIDALWAEQLKAQSVTINAIPPVATTAIQTPTEPEIIPPAVEIETPAEEIHVPAEHETTPAGKPNVFDKLKKSWIFWAVSALVVGGVIAFIIHGGHKDKEAKKTEQVEKTIQDQKAQLGKAEVMLNEMASRRTDSAINEVSQLMSEAVSYQKAWVNTMQRMNDIQKEQNEKLQERIRTANNDTLRRIGSELSGQ